MWLSADELFGEVNIVQDMARSQVLLAARQMLEGNIVRARREMAVATALARIARIRIIERVKMELQK